MTRFLLILCYLFLYCVDASYIWIGGVTSTSFSIRIACDVGDFFLVQENGNAENMTLPRDNTLFIGGPVAPTDLVNGIAAFEVTGLQSSTNYGIGTSPGFLNTTIYITSVSTFSPENSPLPSSITVGFVSNFEILTNSYAWDKLLAFPVSFVVVAGDLFSLDETESDVTVDSLHNFYSTVVENENTLFQSIPVVYTVGSKDTLVSSSSNPSATAAINAYQSFAGHYAYGFNNLTDGGASGLFQAFSVGRIRFIVTDLITQSDGKIDTMGSLQLSWFKNELENWNQSSLLIWVSSKGWLGTNSQWSDFAFQRTEIADLVGQYGVQNLIMLCGGADLLGMDDGSNNDYSASHYMGFPVISLGSMAASKSDDSSDATFSEGCVGYDSYPANQYSLMTLSENASYVCVDIESYNPEQQGTSSVLSYSQCLSKSTSLNVKANAGNVCSLPTWPGWVIAILVVAIVLLVIVAVIAGLLLFRQLKGIDDTVANKVVHDLPE